MTRLYWFTFLCIVGFASCKKSVDIAADPIVDSSSANIVAPVTETFENGTKAIYDKGYIRLSTGIWLLDNAAIGATNLDKKVGVQAARLMGNGSLAMKFDVTNGVRMIVIAHGMFNNDADSQWQLWLSENSGTSYYQAGANITSTQQLRRDTFYISSSGFIRLSIRKVSGAATAINIDDVFITNELPTPPLNADNGNMLMGNPDNATTDVNNPCNYLMDKRYFALSYCRDRGIPNWVSWHLQQSDIGSVSRQDDFRADPAIPFSWYQVGSGSYSGSGFDRGHNCPSADRTSSVEANSTTFLMTNIIPQAPRNNQQTWANLEDYARSLVGQGNEVYIIMGSYGAGGTGSNGSATSLDNGRVTVPANIWKVLVVLPMGMNDLSRVSTNTRVIAVNTPNINTINTNWRTYRTSVDAIESATGYDLLSNVPPAVQQVIESVVDNQ